MLGEKSVDPNQLASQKPADLDLHYFQNRIYPGSARQGLTLIRPCRDKTCLWGGGCEQQRHRPACASVQTDQRLCYSLIGKDHI